MLSSRARVAALAFVIVVYLHNTLPYLTMMPRVNVDEPWLMERAYQVMQTGVPRQPMYGLNRAYLLQAGYPYLLAMWMSAFGVGLRQARLLGVVLGLGIVLVTAALGRRLLGSAVGVFAALFLAADSNFLGGARNARTDLPAVFFAVCAFACYAIGRDRPRRTWWIASGAFTGLAMLCHGNALWVAVILALWVAADCGRRLLVDARTWWIAGGAAALLAPYVAVLALNWKEVQSQVNAFVVDRVPFYSPSLVLREIGLEVARYRTWYFGLVTNTVPNPLLWTFQAATVLGVGALTWRLAARRGKRGSARAGGEMLVLALVAGTAFIFAAFINNKVPAYMPHLLVGFSLLAGVAVVDLTKMLVRRDVVQTSLIVLFLVGYGAAATAYYEKWYSTTRKSELVPYEQTEATLRALVPPVPKYVFGSPHFWAPFHADAGTTFLSYGMGAQSAGADRPAYLLVDELQWLPDSTAAGHESLGGTWVEFIARHCALDSVALGTAYGTIGAFRCERDDRLEKPELRTPEHLLRIIGGTSVYRIGERLQDLTAADLVKWPRYDDPRRRAADRPDVSVVGDRLRIAGTGWPGIVMDYPAIVGEAYLIRVVAHDARDGDLLYLGTWKQPQVLSLAGAASAGMPTPLAHEAWFPGDRAFVATAPRVRIAIYSEAPRTDFAVSSVQIFHLRRDRTTS